MASIYDQMSLNATPTQGGDVQGGLNDRSKNLE